MRAYTWCEVPCIQSLGCIERLRTVHIAAMRKSVVEGCIQSQQKCPGEIVVCTRAVENAASIDVNSSGFPTLSVVDSFSEAAHELGVKQPTNGNAIIVCFVVSTPRVAVLRTIWRNSIGEYFYPIDGETVEVQEGRWVWIGVFTQRSRLYSRKLVTVILKANDKWRNFPSDNGTVEKGFLATVEEDRAMEALHGLLGLMGI